MAQVPAGGGGGGEGEGEGVSGGGGEPVGGGGGDGEAGGGGGTPGPSNTGAAAGTDPQSRCSQLAAQQPFGKDPQTLQVEQHTVVATTHCL